MDSGDPRLILAARLRELRENWHVTQKKLALALGGGRPLSESLISSWESKTDPTIPPLTRLNDYAALFATQRSFAETRPLLIRPDDMSRDERRARDDLQRELLQLRADALKAPNPPSRLRGSTPVASALLDQVTESLSRGPWRFADGDSITIVCAQWPTDMRQRIPYTDPDDPDYTELLTFSELDSLFELHGHLRAANPANNIKLCAAGHLTPDDYTSHLIILGGTDWNTTTVSVLEELHLPVEQVADWGVPDGLYFEVEENGQKVQHRPVLREAGNKSTLLEDVSLFVHTLNPFNQDYTVTMCNGMYGRGTYGTVRALTDPRFRDRNADYLASRFGDAQTYCLLTRVRIVNGATITPDWAKKKDPLFEWSGPADASR